MIPRRLPLRVAPLLLALIAAAPDPRDAQQAAEAAARDAVARASAEDVQQQRLASALVAAAAELRTAEDEAAAVAERAAALQVAADAAAASVAARAAALAPVLPLSVRLAAFPIETLLSVPAAPDQAIRGILVLQAYSRTIRAEAAVLAAEERRSRELAAQLATVRQAAGIEAARQRELATALDRQAAASRARQVAARGEADEATRRLAAAVAHTGTLRAAVATVASRAAPAAPEPAGVMAAGGAGRWATPVSGRLARGFGTAGEGGAAAGVSFQTAPGARVTAPCGGSVAFAGTFRSYGRLLILACGGGTHAVLAGLDRLDAQLGQRLQAGEPVGAMAASGGVLYLEARRDGQAVDPQLFLARTR